MQHQKNLINGISRNKDSGCCARHNPSVSIKDTATGITLIALVITIIVRLCTTF